MHSRNTVLLAILLTLAIQTIVVFAFQNPVLDGQLNGADSYMRLRRVLHLYETGSWYDAFDLRTNAPYGELIHWTRLLDAILFAGAWIGSAVTEFPRALFVWGIFVSPALLLVLAPIWSWGTRPVLGSGGYLLSFALFPLLSLLNGTFRPGNPDHHGLLALFFLSMIAIFIRLAHGQSSVRVALAAGLIAGAAIWVGIVEVFAATYFGTALALLWLWRDKPYDRHVSGYIIGLVLAIVVALAIEQTAVIRLATLALVGAVSILLVALVFPRFFQAPIVDAGSPLIDEWLANNIEFQSIWPVDRAARQIFFAKIGPAIIALVYMIWRWRSASAELRNVFAVLLIGYLFYLPLALSAVRWASFVQALALLPLVMTIVAAWRWEGAIAFANQRIRLRSTAVTLVIFGPLFASAVVAGSAPAERSPHAGVAAAPPQAQRHQRCSVTEISTYLSATYKGDKSQAETDILLTYLNWGAEIVWRTPYDVVGAPYANLASLTDTSKMFHATVDASAANIVRQRGIDLILVCTNSFEQYPDTGAVNLHNRLIDRQPPQWLDPVDLPAHLAPAFRLYRVNTDALPG